MSGVEARYKVHFIGWNKSHDEWVESGRLRQNTAVNIKLKDDLEKQHLGKMKKKRLKKTDKPNNRVCGSVETKEEYLAKVTFNIELPRGLNTVLVDDWDLVTRQKQFSKLPANVTVVNILDAYRDKKIAENNDNEKQLCEFIDGIRGYFDSMLLNQLLYATEKSHFADVMTKNLGKAPSQICGVSHLLRLFVRLGQILAFTDITQQEAATVLTHIHDFLSYLQENIKFLFSAVDYILTA